MSTLFETAFNWVVQGFGVIPIQYRDKRPDAHLLPLNEKDEPSWEIFKTQLPSIDQLKIWFPTKLHNLALIMGWNNLVVIDFDQIDVFDFWHKQNPINTYMVKTQRGMHVYLQVKTPPANYHSLLLDIKASGYVLIPPSVHPSGFIYQVHKDLPILKVENLSDVLPEEFTAEQIRQPVDTQYVAPVIKSQDDPWARAETIGADAIDTIRNQANLLAFFPDARQKSRDGRWWIATCPFHHDHNPSFWIDTARQICGCYSGCTPKPLDTINLYSRLYGMSNQDAIRALTRSL